MEAEERFASIYHGTIEDETMQSRFGSPCANQVPIGQTLEADQCEVTLPSISF